MPDADGFPTPDELIAGPTEFHLSVALPLPQGKTVAQCKDELKAATLCLSGFPFLCIVMRPTGADGKPCEPNVATGCDYLTVLHGDRETLMAVRDALDGVIDRLYKKKGII